MRLHATLLIDEVEWNSSSGSRALRQLSRSGTTRSLRALRVQESALAFGPKVFSSLEPSPDPALNSRAVQIIMGETTNSGLVKPSDPRMIKLADELRQMLLRFRFNHYHSIRPLTIPGSEDLRPRSRDLLSSLAAPLANSGHWQHLLLAMFKAQHDPATRESLSSRQGALLAALFEIIHSQPNLDKIRVGGSGNGSLTELANSILRESGERISLSDKATGSMLSAMGFHSTMRTNAGWSLWLDSAMRERTHQLAKNHDNSNLNRGNLTEDCAECVRFGLLRK